MEVNSVRLSQNERYLLSSGTDGKARIWDLRKGLQLQLLSLGPISAKCKAVFLSDDNYVASISADVEQRDIRLHDATSGHVIGDLAHHHPRLDNCRIC